MIICCSRRWEKWLCAFFILGVTSRAIATYSRGGFLGAGALVLVYILRSKRKFQALIGATVVAVVVLSVLPQSFWDRMSTIHASEDKLEDDSARSRLHFWRMAVAMADDHPLLGIGYNAYTRVYDRYDILNGQYGHNRAVHSMWFGVLAELGYVGLALYVALLVLAIMATTGIAGRARRGELPMEFHYYAVAIQTAFAAAFVAGSFVPFQYTEMFWHFIGLSGALRNIALSASAAREPVVAIPKVKAVYSTFQPRSSAPRA